MNITYLIGNGFDIACGLKTRYSDFLRTYIPMVTNDKDICLFKDKVNANLSTWADAEYAFGRLTNTITDPLEFTKCFNHFLNHLAQYLSDEQKKINCRNIKKTELRQIIEGLVEFQSSLCSDSKKVVFDCTKDMDCSTYNFSFLVFNYTEVFEKVLFSCIPKESEYINFLNNGKRLLQCRIDTFEYAHGCLQSLPLIFGVNDVDQISSPVQRGLKEIVQTIIKPIQNEKTREVEIVRCKEALKCSDIVCIYGMSLGATDSMWWDMIIEWMEQNKMANLIIHYWDLEFSGAGAGRLIQARDFYRGKLFDNAKTRIRMQRGLMNRIHVVLNSNPFHIAMHV